MRAADEAATQAKLSKAFARPVGAAIKVKKAKTAAATDKKKQLNQVYCSPRPSNQDRLLMYPLSVYQ